MIGAVIFTDPGDDGNMTEGELSSSLARHVD
jgi:hypothetical protein